MMARMLHFTVSLTAMLLIGGCGWRAEDKVSDPNETVNPGLVQYQPEGIITRSWSGAEVTYRDFDVIETSSYFNSYEKLDASYQVDADTSDNWTKSNMKRAILDPLATIRDTVLAPFKYSRDAYSQSKSEDSSDCQQ